jgi:hypothetical protein
MVENESIFRQRIETFLKDNGFLPSEWDSFELSHGNGQDKEHIISKIRKNVGKKSGLYVYEKNGSTLYVGKAKSLFGRIKSHYRESYKRVPGDTKQGTWHAFFSANAGQVKIFWKEEKSEKIRRVIERMLAYVKRPKFEEFKEEYESKK